MYTKLTYIALVLLLSLTACNKNEDGGTATGRMVPVSFAAGITTRIVDSDWESGDNIGISMLLSGSADIAGEAFNREYQVSGPGSLSSFLPVVPAETIFFPNNESKVDFLAYYPYSKGLKSLSDLPISIADQFNRKRIDLLIARISGIGKDLPNADLVFRHRMTSLEFDIVRADAGNTASLSGAVLRLKKIPVAANYNLYTGEITPSAHSDVIAWMSGNGTKGSAIVFPREPGNAIGLEITLTNGMNFSASIDAQSRWEPGTCYLYTITLRKKPVPVDISVSVTDWTSDSQQGKLE